MRIQTILNRVEKFKSFTYGDAQLVEQDGGPALVVQIVARKKSRPYCSGCLKRGRPYDRLLVIPENSLSWVVGIDHLLN